MRVDTSAPALVLLCLTVWLPRPAAAQPFTIDQMNTRASSGISDLDCGWCQSPSLVVAEDFVLTTPRSIAEITLWGGYVDDEAYDDHFTVQIFTDDAGLPATPALVTRTGVPFSRTATGEVVPFSGSPVDEYRYTLRLPSPPLLAPGTYWVEVANDSTGQVGDFVWGFGLADNTNGRPGSAVSVSGTLWFANPTNWNLQVPWVLLADGFESGTTNAWSAATP